MTDLQKLYFKARSAPNRLRHRAAVESVATATGLDPDTGGRCLHRARRADERDVKKGGRA